ncbi:MAG TPA: sugar ABC transporter substrate-binding protein [Bacillota bacterium]|nr:sugar ABC transporter substrate-binding protein [Bacillota bacterium]
MKKRLAIILALLLAVSAVMAGCGSKPDDKAPADSGSSGGGDKTVIGFIPMTLNNEYFITMVNGAKQKAAELGIELNVQAGDQHASAAEQLTIVENMITSGVDAICIVPSSSEGLAAALKKCKDANIPVINLDTKLDDSVLKEAGMTVPFYGTDNYAGAKTAGEYVKAHFNPGTKTAILTGIEGQQNAADRRNGFIEGAGDAIKVVAEQSANWEVDQGYAATQNILTANPDVELIYCGNDGMAIGAVRAVKEANKTDQIKVIGFDGISEALNMIASGELYGSVAQFPAEMGILGVENAVKMIKGEDVEQNIDTGAKLILPENVKEHQEYCAKYAD